MADNSYDCIIIGGGAAGMTAAVFAAQRGRKTLLLERNGVLGKKLSITGKGRCNLTNNCGGDEFFENIISNPRFLYSAYSAFSSHDCMDFFSGLGVPLKTERGKRVFPVSDKAADIVGALKNALDEKGVTVKNLRAENIAADSGVIRGVQCGGGFIGAESVLIATGGKSYPKTGSDGDGYKFAKALGHSVTDLCPSLVPVEICEDFCFEMAGLSLKNVALSLIEGASGKKIFSETGEALFTHTGVSGPLVLSASAFMAKKTDYKLLIDLKPALDERTLDKRILRDFSQNPNRDFYNSLSGLLPSKMIKVFAGVSGISDKKVHSVTKEERAVLVRLFKAFPLTVKRLGSLSEAVVTRGGVNVSEVSPKTMMSKIINGLYFAGEVLDLDGFTGGFNLQIAFSTAVCAGKNM